MYANVGGGRTVELYVRSLASREAHERQEGVIERLRDLDERGAIDGFDVVVWGRTLCRESHGARTEVGRSVVDRLDRVEEWVDGTARSIAQFCRTERLDSAITGESREVVSLPSLALAEFDGGELVRFAPCREDREVVSVSDRLLALDPEDGADGGSGSVEPAIEGDAGVSGSPDAGVDDR